MQLARASYCTVTDYFYTPKALVLYQSLAELVDPSEFDFSVLCLDERAEQIFHNFRFKNLHPIPASAIPELSSLNDRPIFERACASKPFLLEYLLEQKHLSKLCYFDSDMFFLSDPSFLFNYLENYNVVLKPAITEPAAVYKDWQWVSCGSNYTGYYNGGFIGVGHRALSFVRWWKQLCIMGTSHDYDSYIVGDQRYLDYVPGCFDKVLLLRHKGCNFKHWMVKYGEVRRVDGKLFVGNDPVVFFHFSQNLGNVSQYDPLVHPEAIDYLARLKAARLRLGVRYFGTQGHKHYEESAPGPTSEISLSRRILHYIETRAKLIPPDILVSGRYKKSLRLLSVRKLARLCLKFNGAEVILSELEMTHPISPKTLEHIYHCAATVSGIGVSLGAMDGIPAIASLLAGRKTIVIDSFEARYFHEASTFINPKLSVFHRNLTKLRLEHAVELWRGDPAEQFPQDKSPVSLLMIDATLGKESIINYVRSWLGSLSPGAFIVCTLPQEFDSSLLDVLHAAIIKSFSKNLEKIPIGDDRVILYRCEVAVTHQLKHRWSWSSRKWRHVALRILHWVFP